MMFNGTDQSRVAAVEAAVAALDPSGDPAALKTQVETWAVRTSDGVFRIVPITQAAYDALGTKVATTLYLITG